MICPPNKLPPPPPPPPAIPPSPVASISHAPKSSSIALSHRVKALPTPPQTPESPQLPPLLSNCLYSIPTRSRTMNDLAVPRKSRHISVKSASAAEIKLPSRPPPPVPTLPARSPSAPSLATAVSSESDPHPPASKLCPTSPASRPRTPASRRDSKSPSWLPRLPPHLDFLHDWGFVLVLVYLLTAYFLVFRHLPAVNAVALASVQLAGLIQGNVAVNQFPGTWPGV